jgi:hypothetical protein
MKVEVDDIKDICKDKPMLQKKYIQLIEPQMRQPLINSTNIMCSKFNNYNPKK